MSEEKSERRKGKGGRDVNTLTGADKYRLCKALEGIREEVERDGLGPSELARRLGSELGLTLTPANLKYAAKSIGLPLGLGKSPTVFKQMMDTVAQHEEAIVKLRAEVAELRRMVEEVVTAPTGTRYTIQNGNLVKVPANGPPTHKAPVPAGK